MRMQVPRQARLESTILLALREREAASVAELAGRVDASRPSTSRAFAALTKKGLAQTNGRRRSLTGEGRQAAVELLEPSAAVRRILETDQRQVRTMVERAQAKHFLGNTVMFDTMRMVERNYAALNKLADSPAAALRLAGASSITDPIGSTNLSDLTAVKRFAQLELGALQTIKLADVSEALSNTGSRTLIDDVVKRFAGMPIPKGALGDLAPRV